VPLVHELVGYVVVALFAVGWVWGVGAWLSKRGPGDRFWRWLTLVQVVSVAQVLIGVTLFVVGRRQGWLHYAYGIFPLFALAVACGLKPFVDADLMAWIEGLDLDALIEHTVRFTASAIRDMAKGNSEC